MYTMSKNKVTNPGKLGLKKKIIYLKLKFGI